ncbi:hypothetical protein NE237_032956 [Protea cynaroides]|uniref:Uncharacterized protein n=1 Tax=Protea cynaroides TaxID=273540 RepID=A0A9Q0L5D9_9MAGN|nr:hypothetical protein NE237_032956 [Protea cynaroides]
MKSCRYTKLNVLPAVGEALGEKKSYREKKAPLPNHSVFDLNQVLTGEDDEEFQVLEPVRLEKKPKNQLVSMVGGEQLTDLNLPVCRDIGMDLVDLQRGGLHGQIRWL